MENKTVEFKNTVSFSYSQNCTVLGQAKSRILNFTPLKNKIEANERDVMRGLQSTRACASNSKADEAIREP
jgi:hypothetical protein